MRNFFTPVRLLFSFFHITAQSIYSKSPTPVAMYVRELFKENPIATEPENYAEIQAKVDVTYDLEYPSDYKKNQYDLYLPRKKDEKVKPLIFWVHGGAFVAGDKDETEIYCTLLAAQGYPVISMNYQLAPEAKYPVPIHQVAEMYEYLVKTYDGNEAIDVHQLFFAGDSAGAQIVSQFLNVQTNSGVAERMNMEQNVPQEDILGVLLYCGPFDLQSLYRPDILPLNFYLNRVGWSYVGHKSWVHSEELKDADVIKNVTDKFPPTFITDANIGSFEKSGKMLAKRLEELGVPVTTSFFTLKEKRLTHEFQFKMGSVEGQETFDLTLHFLKEYTQE